MEYQRGKYNLVEFMDQDNAVRKMKTWTWSGTEPTVCKKTRQNKNFLIKKEFYQYSNNI